MSLYMEMYPKPVSFGKMCEYEISGRISSKPQFSRFNSLEQGISWQAAMQMHAHLN